MIIIFLLKRLLKDKSQLCIADDDGVNSNSSDGDDGGLLDKIDSTKEIDQFMNKRNTIGNAPDLAESMDTYEPNSQATPRMT